MLKPLTNAKEYLDFVRRVNGDPSFSDPLLRSEEMIQSRLLESPGEQERLWGVFEGDQLLGLFGFLVLEEESYLEMLCGVSRSPQAYEEMLSFLKENYGGFQADFIYNPGNHLLHGLLQRENAEFDKEAQNMILEKEVPCQSSHQIELYSPAYREQYLSIHTKEGYWTGEKVLDAQDKFRVLLAIEKGEVVGYIDVTYKYDENEPFDVFVKEEHRKKGYGRAMLWKAIELNRPKAMVLQVYVDNAPAIALYEASGFVRIDGANSIVAHASL